MLASKYRLSKNDDFRKIKREGKLYQSESFGVQVLEKEREDVSRFAFIVSTKISNQASQRNRVKRAMREAIRHQLHIIKNGYDAIFLPKKNIVKKSTEEIMREIQTFVKKHLEK
jgi:ribonuclease P protein component